MPAYAGRDDNAHTSRCLESPWPIKAQRDSGDALAVAGMQAAHENDTVGKANLFLSIVVEEGTNCGCFAAAESKTLRLFGCAYSGSSRSERVSQHPNVR